MSSLLSFPQGARGVPRTHFGHFRFLLPSGHCKVRTSISTKFRTGIAASCTRQISRREVRRPTRFPEEKSQEVDRQEFSPGLWRPRPRTQSRPAQTERRCARRLWQVDGAGCMNAGQSWRIEAQTGAAPPTPINLRDGMRRFALNRSDYADPESEFRRNLLTEDTNRFLDSFVRGAARMSHAQDQVIGLNFLLPHLQLREAILGGSDD
jgi:hypothetical protein